MPWSLDLSEPQTLLDGAMTYYAQALSFSCADQLFTSLNGELPWTQESIMIYGRETLSPRLQAWHGDEGISYRYSGKTFTTLPWTPSLVGLCHSINQAFGLKLNSVLANLYRDGQDSMGWHADDEMELGSDPIIVSVSLGAERDFAVRRIGEQRQAGKLALAHGSLLVMEAGMQNRWQHSLPKRQGIKQPRINLTFREIIHSRISLP
ncbi:MAG: alpha-ketoglutarate-dependent dioxygenase AlkB [Thalassolituus oleivorans]|uniref:Alkylated DNA repair protein n=2 Tax=Thalassolituus oleivorans TaxID=187493 RepID=M5E1J3_9GAMM|nr:alpha-ketoglutarate-dependent dioxygenase AlkB [Thalassolituus oleivorans]MBQ0728623.1 alpha-ketoglutarate-dependent dioxygenase AlkB [Thalassolituus oleivorans]CCU71484.1 alkylated DNA repair protein [Thalassolituus oleivorans MIL-1]